MAAATTCLQVFEAHARRYQLAPEMAASIAVADMIQQVRAGCGGSTPVGRARLSYALFSFLHVVVCSFACVYIAPAGEEVA